MKSPKMAQLNICDVLRSISDDKALALFNTIALTAGNATIPMCRLKLTRKQYYSRMSAMTNTGLILRRNGKYNLSTFGRVVYEAHKLIGKAQGSYWKLKAVDAVESSDSPLASEERDRFISSLIGDADLKEILLSCDNNRDLLAPKQSSQLTKYPL